MFEAKVFERMNTYLAEEFVEMSQNIEDEMREKKHAALAHPEAWSKKYYQEFVTQFLNELYQTGKESPDAALVAVIRAEAMHKAFATLAGEMQEGLVDLFGKRYTKKKKRK